MDQANFSRIAAIVSLVIGIIAAIASIIGAGIFFFTPPTITKTPTLIAMTTSTPTSTPSPTPTGTYTVTAFPTYTPSPTETPTLAPQNLETRLALLEDKVTTLQQQVVALSTQAASNAKPNSDLIALRADLSSVDGRLANIEQVVLDSPQKALQFTLLNQEVENLKQNTKEQIAQIYDLTKWFIALMFTIALSIVTNGASLIENTTEIGRITVGRAICRSENAYFYG